MTGYLSESKRRFPTVAMTNSYRDASYSIVERLDPLHEIEWRNVLDIEFQVVGGIRRDIGLDPAGCVTYRDERVEAPLVVPSKDTGSKLSIVLMSLLLQYHQLTTMQLAAFSGTTFVKTRNALHRLYCAGIVKRSHAPWEEESIAENGSGDVWQVNNSSKAFAMWLDRLTDMEYLLITGNGELTKSTKSSNASNSIRHNLTAAEIILRSLEFCPGILGGWGERATSVLSFLDEREIHDSDVRANVADVGMVARNGDVILLETSGQRSLDAASGARIVAKMRAWAAIAAMSDINLKVVLVNISPKVSFGRYQHRLKEAAEGLASHFVSRDMQDKGASSIFLANAYDWFPSTMTVSSGFTTLESWSPFTEKYHDLVSTDRELKDCAVVVNTAAAVHTPEWSIKEGATHAAISN